MDFKYAVALSGSIGSGKSTVCSLLKLHGFEIVDADKIAKNCLEDQAESVAKLFGEEFVKNGVVDRKALASLIFNDKNQKKILEELIHPLVREEISNVASVLDKKKKPYIVDIPLYFETRAYKMPLVVVVYAPKNVIIQRVVLRDSKSEKEALNIVESQLDIEYKKEQADIVIDNSLDLKHLQKEVETAVSKIKLFFGEK